MWEVIESNKRKSIFVLIALIILLGVFGASIGATCSEDPKDMLYTAAFGALIMWIAFPIVFYFNLSFNTKPSKSSGAYEITKANNPKLYNILEEMTIASGLEKTPRMYILDTDALNAYACGASLKNAVVVVTKGLVERLNRDELQGVIAHEISHIVNRDIVYMICAGTIVVIITCVARGLLRGMTRSRRSSSKGSGAGMALIILLIVLILSPILSQMFYMFLSRKREYLADACAAQFTRYPKGLADALYKISSEAVFADKDFVKQTNPLVAASYIVPFDKKKTGDGLFSTHPLTENRIKILMKMAGADYRSYNDAYRNVTGKSGVIPNGELQKAERIQIKGANELLVVGTLALQAAETVAQKPDINAEIKKHRECEDMMWNLAKYTTVHCSCGTKLKIPECYKGQEIICPHCKEKHKIM